MTKQGFECYKMYLAMQRHFSGSYDFFKYNGKVSATTKSYEKRNDLYSFEKLSKIVQEADRLDFFLCHFIEDPKCWIRSMSKDNLTKYQNRMNKLSQAFDNDMELMFQHPEEERKPKNGIPFIHNLAIERKISKESIIILDMMKPFIDKDKEAVSVSFLFPDYIDGLINYRPFLTPKINNLDILRDVLKSKL